MFRRPNFQQLVKRLNEPKLFIQVINGPRQVGKTTLIQQVLNDIKIPSMYITADGIVNSNSNWIETQWNIARLKLKNSELNEIILVIDEIQKVDNWSEIVKANWDADKINSIEIKLVLLGSSRLLLQKGLTESLAGRFESIYMGHWSFSEMQEAFGFSEEQFVWFGGYPGAAELIVDENRWKDYILNSLIETTVSKDILLIERINKPALLRNLFELGCSFSGQILSYTKILGQLHDAGNTTTLSHYLKLLDSAGLLSGLEKFSHGKIMKRTSSPRFQVYNSALFSALSENSFSESVLNTEIWGRHVESAVGVHLLNSSKSNSFKLMYWRQGNYEVDFVLEYKHRIIGLEVKSGSSKVTKGMVEFDKLFRPHKTYLISQNGLSWQEFLKINPVELF
ncbi:MAG: ATP-binding protein [Draconibacterium sp.]|nr:ATP-binding protein [Draconibacterium sp.]